MIQQQLISINVNKNNPFIPEDLKNYVLIIDEINRANLSSVLGELIYALEYRGETVDSMYEVGSRELMLPPNLYIIGTMNTADRSVGHIDYAIRRRFAFVDVLPTDLVELGDDFKSDLFKKVKALFTRDNYTSPSSNLSGEFNPKDVSLGHSYFIQHYEKDENGENIKENPIDFSFRLEYEIKPILLEYVKDGILMGNVEGQKIEDYIKAL
ncbi:AAA family ATPase [Chryseobacterium wanjuense]